MNLLIILILFIFFVLSSYLLGIKSNPIEFTKNPEEGDFFEGDILGIEKDEKGAYLMPYKYSEPWPNGQVPYFIDPESNYNYTEIYVIESALRNIEEVTKLNDTQVIRFIDIKSEANLGKYPAAVRVYRGDGCNFYVGMRKDLKIQNVSLGNGCVYKGTVAHEFMHALGYEHAFDKYSSCSNPSGIVIALVDFPYDYKSIMHYGTNYFSKNGEPTMPPKISGAQIGLRDRVTIMA